MSYESKMEKIQAMEKELAALKKEIQEEQSIEFTIEGFKNRKFVVNCKTKDDSNIFLAYLTGKNIVWIEQSAIKGAHNWDVYRQNTCYAFNCDGIGVLSYTYCSFYKDIGLPIVDFNINMLK